MFYDPDLAYIHHRAYSGFVSQAVPGLLKVLAENGIAGGLVLDLGCGSGLWARELTSCGYDAIGIDVSPSMIALARKTAPKARFVAGSFLDITLPACVAVTALGEVLNYTFDRDSRRQSLARFFRRVHQALQPGGVFIFDVAGPERERGRAPHRWYAGQDWAILLEVATGPGTLTRQMTVFRKIGKMYRRSEEVHRLRLYRPADILRDLRAAGFSARRISGYGESKFDRGLAGFVGRKP